MFSYKEAFEATKQYFNGDELASSVFLGKYALKDNEENILEKTPEDMHKRLAKEFARIESKKFQKPLNEQEIFNLFDKFKYIIPQGSPMYGIGNDYQIVSLSNCYLLSLPLDSYNSILQVDQELVNICKRRGGVGIDLSNLRPRNSMTKNAARTSTGITSWMERYSNSIREVGQCIAKGQRVLTRDGLKKIEEVIPNSDMVWTKEGWIEVLRLYKNGLKKVFKLTAKNGQSISCSAEHIIQTFDESGKLFTKCLKDFKVGDNIILCLGDKNAGYNEQLVDLIIPEYKNINNKPKNCILPNKLDKKLAYLLGYAYGDGSVEKNKFGNKGLALACSNDYREIKQKLKEYCLDVFDYEINVKSGDGDLEKYTIYNTAILHFLEYNRLLKQKSGELIFPEAVIASPKEIQIAFIAGYFDADGYSSGSKSGYSISSICVSFLKEIQILLNSFGIISKIHAEDRSKYGWKILYRLTIVGMLSQKRLVSLFEDSFKINNCKFVSKRDSWLTSHRASDLNTSHNKYNYCPDNSQFLSFSCVDKLQMDGVRPELKNVFVQNIVESITEIGQIETFDLELITEHMFWCEGFYVHNSGRRGALMLTLDVHHPDVIDFCTIKNDPIKVTGANISVKLSREFVDAVENNTEYELRFPVDYKEKGLEPKISKMVSAQDIWNVIVKSAHNRAEPGILPWYNTTLQTPADYYDDYKSKGVNPCSEINLSPLDSCRLLCLNLYSYVVNKFSEKPYFDYKLFYEHCKIAQRLMDDIVDLESEKIDKIIAKVKSDPEPMHVKQAEINLWKKIKQFNDEGRRTGTGITALGDCLAALNIKYGSEESIKTTEYIYQTIKFACYESSIDMAEELGSFKDYNAENEKSCPYIQKFAEETVNIDIEYDWLEIINGKDLLDRMEKFGRRNIALTTTAPTGTVSIMTQTSSGIEPIFMLSYKRRKKINPNDKESRVDFIDQNGDSWEEFEVYHERVKDWMKVTGKTDLTESPWYNATAEKIDWINRVKLQAAAQKHVCHAISSTLNVPEDITEAEVGEIYLEAFRSGCKGITIYRKNCRTGVLVESKEKEKIINNATKRPEILPCDIFETKIKGEKYFVIVGLMDESPYEIFAGKLDFSLQNNESGFLKRTARGKYQLQDKDGKIIEPNICDYLTDNEQVLTRLVSTALRHNTPLEFLVHQVEKADGELMSSSKIICRILKRYIKEGTKITGESCPECSSQLIRSEGCVKCVSCPWSKCN